MDIMELGAIGELLGGIAVIGSLIYVGLQVRQNTRAVSASTFHAVASVTSDTVTRIAENPELAALIEKGFFAPEELTQSERFRAGFWLRGSFRQYENYAYQADQGLLDPRVYQGYFSVMAESLRVAFIREWWEGAKGGYGPEFREQVDRIVAESEASSSAFTAIATPSDADR